MTIIAWYQSGLNREYFRENTWISKVWKKSCSQEIVVDTYDKTYERSYIFSSEKV